jgi:hypothetical protein
VKVGIGMTGQPDPPDDYRQPDQLKHPVKSRFVV